MNLALRRAKYLHETATHLTGTKVFHPFFEEDVTVHDYLRLDEMVVNFYLQEWIHEDDEILSDLANRFVNRELFKYLPFDGSYITKSELEDLFKSGH